MRLMMITAAVVAVGACSRGAANNNATTNTAAPAANNAAAPAAGTVAKADADGLPDGFLSNDPAEQAANCYGFLTVAREAGATPGGRDAPIMEQAAGQWLAAIPAHASRSQDEVAQQFRPMIEAMGSVPPAQRDAAAAWCVENAPDPA